MDRNDFFAHSSDEVSRPAELLLASSELRRDAQSAVRRLRSAIGDLLVSLKSAPDDARDSAVKALSRAALLLQTATLTQPRNRPAQNGLALWQGRALASYVETNLDKPIRSSELASVVRLDPAYFCRVFRASFGESPLKYVSRRRIERAQKLMLSTDTSLSQIAFDCGFADQAHFTRLFRRVTGDTPRAWRRAHDSSAPADARTAAQVDDRVALLGTRTG